MVNPLREEAPGVAADPSLRTGAGTPVFAQVTVTNHAREPRVLAVTALGVDAAWLPAPSRSQPLMPGASAQLDLPLHPAIGTMPARYPLTVAVQALDPASGAVTAPTAMTEIVLVVDAPGQVGVELAPADVTAVFGKRIAVLLRNTGPLPAEVRLDVQAPTSARIRLGSGPVLVRPGETVRVAGRARVRRVRFLGHRARHAYTVTARSTGAPRHAQGSVTERAILGPAGAKVGVIMTVIAVWLVVGALLIPKLADHVKSGQGGGPNATETAPATGAAGGPGGGGGAGGGSGAGGGGAGGGAGGAGGSASGAAKKVRLNGTVAGAAAAGVAVTLRPTSLVEKQAETATPIGIAPQTLAVHGMVQAGSVNLTAPGTVSPKRATVTSDDGAWSFPGISAPGYYLLTFARPGYQTQRYVINAAETAATEPLKVTLAAGQGTLGGTIAGPSGPVGGAQITITDGTNTITTSSNSRGNVGRWSVDGLSTPSTYLVSAGKDGLGTESRIVTLAAGGSAQADLTLHAGVASLVGTVQGVNDLGDTTGLGGVSVSATDGTVTRTATTVTDGPVGRYTLPGLPVPGRYTVTITADGYQQQTREVSLAKGASKATVSGTLTRSTAVVAGKVTVPESGDAEGAGLVLSNPNQTYKTMSGSGGTFRLNGVAPGSYVIAADLFGFTQEFVAVVAVAGRTASVNIALHSQPNGGLPSTAQIRIQGVMDATTNGPITCATAPACPLTIAVDSGTADDFDSSDMPPGGYVVPASSGLAPGLHKVIVHADGYEDVTVSAQVPVGDASTLTPTATVPTVTLFPAPKLVGTITAAVGSATGVCVVAAPSGTPTGCTEGEGIVDPDTGAYELTLPSHGTYQVSVLTPSGSEYIAVPPISMTFGLGQTLRYDATLHRLGRIDVTLLHPDATTGLLVPVPDNPDVSSAACDDPLTSTGPTLTVTDSALNQVRKVCWNGPKFAFARLQPGTYHISGQYQGHTSASQTVFVDKDQEPSTTVTVVSPLGQFVGRLVSTTGGTTHGVAGATITIGGITGYNGTDPATDQKTVTTDASGCFAITSTGTAATAVSPCGVIAVDDPARATLALATPQATLVISHDDYQPLTLTNKGIGGAGLITVTLTPKPSTFDATDCAASADGCRLRVVPASPAPDLSTANIVVAKQPAGAGRVSVVANSTGELTWDDSNLGPDNEAWPGTYTLTATLPGFAPATSTVTCPLNAHCTMTSFTLQQFGTLVISAADRSTGDPVDGATFTLTGAGSIPQTQIAAPGASGVTFTALAPSASPAYVVHIQAAGYQFDDTGTAGITLACTGGTATTSVAVSPGGTTTCVASLTRLGAIAGTVSADLGAATQPLANATLVARRCTASGDTGAEACATVDASSARTVASASDGTYRVTGTATVAGLASGWWKVSVTAPGYTSNVGYALIPATVTADTALDVTLDVVPVTLQVGVRTSTTGTLRTDATVTLFDSAGTPTTVTTPDTTSHLYVFAGIAPTTYSLQVSGTTIATINLQVTLAVGVSPQTIYVLTDVSASTVSGTISGQQGSAAAAAPLSSASVSIGHGDDAASFAVANGVDNQPMTATTGSSPAGYFSISTVPDGTYNVQISHSGYESQWPVITVVHGQAQAQLNVTLSRVTHNVVVDLSSVNGFALTGATASLTPTGSNPPQADQPFSPTSPGGTHAYRATFTAVPFGDWTLAITLPAHHYGTIVGTGSTSGFTVTVPGNGNPNTAVNPTYSLTEGELDLAVVGDTDAVDSPPATVSLTVTHSASTVYSNTTFPTGAGAAIPIWVTAGSYAVAVDPQSSPWVAKSVTFSVGSGTVDGTVTITETSSITIHVTHNGAALPGTTHATVTLTPQDGQTVPPAYTSGATTGTGDNVTLTGLPAGDWKFTAAVGGDSTTSGTITLVPGAAGDDGLGATLTIDVLTPP